MCLRTRALKRRTGFVAKPFESDSAPGRESWEGISEFLYDSSLSKGTRRLPHEKALSIWLQLAVPQAKLKDIRAQIGACARSVARESLPETSD